MLIFYAAVCLAPLAAAVLPFGIPGVVYEIVLGALLGPYLLDWIHVGPMTHFLSEMGLGVLFLLAGFEVEPAILKGTPLKRSVTGWVGGALLAGVATTALYHVGLIHGVFLSTIAVTTTAIGALYPVLRDQGWLVPPYNAQLLTLGAMGEAAPLIALALVLASGHREWEAGVMLLMALGGGVAIALAGQTRKTPFAGLVHRTMDLSGQLPVRLTVMVMLLGIVLSREFDIDLVLGSFLAGAVCRAAIPHELHRPLLTRLEGLGYGFLVPIFFVSSGANLDLPGLLQNPRALLLIPIFLALMLLARGLPVLFLYKDTLAPRTRVALALHASTQLPLVVAISAVGTKNGIIPPAQAAAMVGAGVLSLLLFPLLAARLKPESFETESQGERPLSKNGFG